MTQQRPHWMSVFIDVPRPVLDVDLKYWTEVTGTTLGEPKGDHGEYLPLQPPDGDPCLWLQRIDAGPVGCHPDLYVDDVRAAVENATDLGATVVREQDGLVVLDSPGGMPFCLVRHRGQCRRPGPVGEPGRRSVVDQICLDIPPARYDAECGFWAGLTGWLHYDHQADSEFTRLKRPPEIPYAVLLQRLDDEQPRVTAHLDLAADNRDAEAARQVAAGAELVTRMPGWTVMRDPAGVVYCNTTRKPGDV
jgi:hypothetical protein